MPASLILLALMAGPPRPAAAPVFVKTLPVAGWTLVVRLDSFSGRASCRLGRPGIGYGRHALTLRLPGRPDTAGAVYRIDDAAPTAARDDDMELARLGFALHADDLANPSGGVVRIPERRLADARVVAVRARPGKPFVEFRIDGLPAALDKARAEGCSEGSFD
jgi:hypothetical protein